MNAIDAVNLWWLGALCSAFGLLLGIGAWWAEREDVLPPPNKAANRDHYQEFQS